MYYDVPEGLGLRKIAEAPRPAGNVPAFIQKHMGSLLRGLAGGALLGRATPPGYGTQQMTNRNSGGSAKNAPVIPQRPGIPAPADDPAPSNQRPGRYSGYSDDAMYQYIKEMRGNLRDIDNPAVWR